MPQVEVSESAFEAVEAMRTVGDGVVSPVNVVFAVGDDCKIVGQVHKGVLEPVRNTQLSAVAEFIEQH